MRLGSTRTSGVFGARAVRRPKLATLASEQDRAGDANSKRKSKVREDWREKARPIKPGGVYPAKEHCSNCGLCDR